MIHEVFHKILIEKFSYFEFVSVTFFHTFIGRTDHVLILKMVQFLLTRIIAGFDRMLKIVFSVFECENFKPGTFFKKTLYTLFLHVGLFK